jgi:dCTP deaminase
MSVLGADRIKALLGEPDASKRLYVTPMLEEKQVSGASIDVRLGFDFLTIKRGNVGAFDPAKTEISPDRFRTPHYLNLGGAFYLHPNEMALGATLEYVRLPLNVSAYVTSRSKWGRRGLIIATATAIHPGFTGTITLELVNHGNVPLVLYPGLAVAQLLLHDAEGATSYKGSLAIQTGPQQASVAMESEHENDFWLKQRGS